MYMARLLPEKSTLPSFLPTSTAIYLSIQTVAMELHFNKQIGLSKEDLNDNGYLISDGLHAVNVKEKRG